MADVLRRILYPAFVLTIVATLWAMGTAQAAADQAYHQTYWPALNPDLFQFNEEPAVAEQSPAGDAPAVHVWVDDGDDEM